MVSKLESGIARQQEMTAQSIAFAQAQYNKRSKALRPHAKEGRLQHFTPVFLKEVSKRIDLLSDYGSDAKLYHKLSAERQDVSVLAATQLLEIFSPYLFIALNESGTTVFSLDSENTSDGQLLVRLYNLTNEKSNQIASRHLLKETVGQHCTGSVTVNASENLEYGNILIADLNLQNEGQP